MVPKGGTHHRKRLWGPFGGGWNLENGPWGINTDVAVAAPTSTSTLTTRQDTVTTKHTTFAPLNTPAAEEPSDDNTTPAFKGMSEGASAAGVKSASGDSSLKPFSSDSKDASTFSAPTSSTSPKAAKGAAPSSFSSFAAQSNSTIRTTDSRGTQLAESVQHEANSKPVPVLAIAISIPSVLVLGIFLWFYYRRRKINRDFEQRHWGDQGSGSWDISKPTLRTSDPLDQYEKASSRQHSSFYGDQDLGDAQTCGDPTERGAHDVDARSDFIRNATTVWPVTQIETAESIKSGHSVDPRTFYSTSVTSTNPDPTAASKNHSRSPASRFLFENPVKVSGHSELRSDLTRSEMAPTSSLGSNASAYRARF